jgi:hypothetical protein
MSKDRDSWEHRVERTLKSMLDVQRDILKSISKGCDTGRRTGSFGFIIGQPKPKTKRMPLELKITNEQQIKVTLAPKTDTGKPAALDGKPTWEVVSGNSTVTVAEDGLSATLVSSDDPGDTQFLVKADADIGDGVEEISDTIKLSVLGATAKNLGLTAGAPEAKPVV